MTATRWMEWEPNHFEAIDSLVRFSDVVGAEEAARLDARHKKARRVTGMWRRRSQRSQTRRLSGLERDGVE
jgi:hypothetical protein